jgi:hypothetical protein
MAITMPLVLASAAQAVRPRPVLGRTVIASRIAGVVRVKAPGKRTFALLAHPQLIAVGATIDATRGTVKLVTATAAGGTTQSGRFSGGAFTVFQDQSDRTTLRLVGGRSAKAVCGLHAKAADVVIGASSSVNSQVLRLLRASAHGHFRTSGRYSAATVRGTQWQTIDRCDGTLTVDTEGDVETTTGTLTFLLKPGQTAIGYCFPPNATPQTRRFCVVEISQPADGLFGFGIGLRRAASAYQLCIRGPSGTERCRQFPLSAPNAAGVRSSAVVCPQDEGAGSYFVRWIIAGQQLGVTLPFTATLPAPPSAPVGCISRP